MLMYWLWLATHEGLSLRKKHALLEQYPDPELLFHNTDKFPDIPWDRNLTRADTILRQCKRQGFGIVRFCDAAYPEQLKSIPDAPLVLYYRGRFPDFSAKLAIGVVGTRKASPYGLQCARQISGQLSPDAIIVSGGAAGVDTRAMQAAVDAGGIAVAVLGCGVDITYPKTNRKLFMDVMERGCILSEYPPQTPPLQWHFPERNRIISGLSDGVLVVEAPAKSGALITARDALEQGRDVFAIPGNIDNLSCAGSNSLLKEGATAVFSGEDIFKCYLDVYPQLANRKPKKTGEKSAPAPVEAAPEEVPTAPDDKKVIDNSQANPYSDGENKQTVADGPEAAVLACLTHSPKPVDEVLAAVDMPSNTVLSILMKLSVKGQVIQHPGKLVSLK